MQSIIGPKSMKHLMNNLDIPYKKQSLSCDISLLYTTWLVEYNCIFKQQLLFSNFVLIKLSFTEMLSHLFFKYYFFLKNYNNFKFLKQQLL